MEDVLIPEKGWIESKKNIALPANQDFLYKAIGLTARFFGRNEVPDVFKLLSIHKGFFWQWLYFASRLMPYGTLPRIDTEVAILRVAWLCRSRYEWGQHIEIAQRLGVKDIDIVHLSQGAKSLKDKKMQLIVQACDDLILQQVLAQNTLERLKEVYSDKKIIELTMLIGHYQMLAGVINSAGLPLDAPIEENMKEFNNRISEYHTLD